MIIGSVVIMVEDLERVKRFYQDAFGLTEKFYDRDCGFAELQTEGGGATIGIATHGAGKYMMPGTYDGEGDSTKNVEIAFTTNSVEKAYRQAIACGAAEMAKPKEMEWGQVVAYVRSVEGTIIGLCSEMQPSDEGDSE